MPFLQAVIKEALRIHLAFGVPIEWVAPEDGATIAGGFFPAGVRMIPPLFTSLHHVANRNAQKKLSIHCWVENRNDLIFEDLDEFRPERWLIEDESKLALMNRH
ncbi:uncharacterized protein LY79DRAFT_34385 [Colletotrichum navitas]|uniref:Uncharacterized protein n=1 Tax=Colletotrichum navitas TaxID=681940 RepID=A0AAD8Q8C8_9PEZI|nr:uncharacterized protein LY79DRAFT_34385 [Colletotrichum navitas]KAK1596878.1 hypothetical protein LY79DRAFT_34385 [Colletotrichum navitas]